MCPHTLGRPYPPQEFPWIRPLPVHENAYTVDPSCNPSDRYERYDQQGYRAQQV